MNKHKSGYTFSFNKLTKVAKPNKPRPPIKFSSFDEDNELCVCHCIDTYLERSESWRAGETQLLLSFIKPHKAISTKTVSRWITSILHKAGIDTKIFGGHSTRSASCSKAKACGVTVKEILNQAYWSNDTVFQKRYCKEVDVDSINHFQSSILKI